MGFKEGFFWGGATAANQYEGGYLSGGKGLAIQDVITGGDGRNNIPRRMALKLADGSTKLLIVVELKYLMVLYHMWMKIHIIQAMWQLISIIIIKKILHYLQKWDLNHSVCLLTGQEFSQLEWKWNQMKQDLNFTIMFLMNC